MKNSISKDIVLQYIFNKELDFKRELEPCIGGIVHVLMQKKDPLVNSYLDRYPDVSCLETEYSQYRDNEEERRFIEQPNISRLFNLENNYGLIEISSAIKTHYDLEPPRIYDLVNNKTIFLHAPSSLLIELQRLQDEGKVNKLSLRGKDSFIYDGPNNNHYCMHYKELGSLFSWNIHKLPSLSKLYEQNYDNQLWIKNSNNELTFEELSDADTIILDSIKTQVVHLVYDCKADMEVVTHVDHEYVYYTLEEFERRKTDGSIKGTAHKRSKTFKVDNGCIPINQKCNGKTAKELPFLYFVLDQFFTHKKLINEYFSTCC